MYQWFKHELFSFELLAILRIAIWTRKWEEIKIIYKRGREREREREKADKIILDTVNLKSKS